LRRTIFIGTTPFANVSIVQDDEIINVSIAIRIIVPPKEGIVKIRVAELEFIECREIAVIIAAPQTLLSTRTSTFRFCSSGCSPSMNQKFKFVLSVGVFRKVRFDRTSWGDI
jgi:hypothetical protein